MEDLYLAALATIVPGLGPMRTLQAVKALGSAKAVFEATGEQLAELGLFNERAIANFLRGRRQADPELLGQMCRAQNIRVIGYFNPDYPDSLKEIHNPPLALYIRGHLPQSGYHVGIVGSRQATPYGLKVARYIAKSLVADNITVISGGASGIDSAAHAAALESGGRTVVVLGCGVDIAYPSENQRLFQGVLQKGALVSEYPPGTAPQARFFPARNRIIVGLSRAVVVCEAAAKSGALITARLAADEHREVYCVPGNIFEPTSVGCHGMLKQGAKLLDDVREIFQDREEYLAKEQMGREGNLFAAGAPANVAVEKSAAVQLHPAAENLSPLGKQIYNLLTQGPLGTEQLVEQTGVVLADLSMELLEMQVKGLIETDQAQRYYRI